MLDIVTSMTSDDPPKSVPVNAAAANARACQAEEGREFRRRRRRKRQAATTANSDLVWSQPCNDTFAGRLD